MREMTGTAVAVARLTKSRGANPDGVPTVLGGGVLVEVVVVTVETVNTSVRVVALGVTVTVDCVTMETWIVLVVAVKVYHVGMAAAFVPVGSG